MPLIAAVLLALIGSNSAVAHAGGHSGAHSDQCLGGLSSTLAAGRFSGALDCDRDRLSLRRLGEVRAGGRVFAIFDYAYRLRPACPNCAVHGGRRIVVMENGRYLGQYGPMSRNVGLSIRQNRLWLMAADGTHGMSVGFSRNGPPRRLVFDGEPFPFSR